MLNETNEISTPMPYIERAPNVGSFKTGYTPNAIKMPHAIVIIVIIKACIFFFFEFSTILRVNPTKINALNINQLKLN